MGFTDEMMPSKSDQRELAKFYANDYVRWRLRIMQESKSIEGPCDTNYTLSVQARAQIKTMAPVIRQFAYKLEICNKQLFDQLDQLDLAIISCKHMFFGILLELVFEERCEAKTRMPVQTFECNWARILASFSLAGYLACRGSTAACKTNDSSPTSLPKPTSSSTLAEWLSQFFNNEPLVFEWIEANGGWSGVADQFTTSDSHAMNTCREKLEPISREDENSNKTVCHRHEHQVAIGSLSEWLGLTLGSIGVLTLALLYIRKK